MLEIPCLILYSSQHIIVQSVTLPPLAPLAHLFINNRDKQLSNLLWFILCHYVKNKPKSAKKGLFLKYAHITAAEMMFCK